MPVISKGFDMEDFELSPPLSENYDNFALENIQIFNQKVENDNDYSWGFTQFVTETNE